MATDFRYRNLEAARKHPLLTPAQSGILSGPMPPSRAGNVAYLLKGIIAELGRSRDNPARQMQEGRGAGRVLLAELLLDGVKLYDVFTAEELQPYYNRLHLPEVLPAPALNCPMLCDLIKRVHTELWRRVAARNQTPTK